MLLAAARSKRLNSNSVFLSGYPKRHVPYGGRAFFCFLLASVSTFGNNRDCQVPVTHLTRDATVSKRSSTLPLAPKPEDRQCRKLLIGYLAIAAFPLPGFATTLTAILKDADASNFTPGATHHIPIWVKGGYDGTARLGIAAVEFEVLADTNGAAYAGTTTFKTAGGTNPLAVLGYAVVNPVVKIGYPSVPTWVPQPVVNGTGPNAAPDAIGTAFFANPGIVVIDPSSPNWIGVAGSPGGPSGNGLPVCANGFEEIAIQNWRFDTATPLSLYIDSGSARYFNSNATNNDGTSSSHSTSLSARPTFLHQALHQYFKLVILTEMVKLTELIFRRHNGAY